MMHLQVEAWLERVLRTGLYFGPEVRRLQHRYESSRQGYLLNEI